MSKTVALLQGISEKSEGYCLNYQVDQRIIAAFATQLHNQHFRS
jgi:hypothetical protein